MLKEIIDILNSNLQLTNYFEQLYCLAELVKRGDGSRPMLYSGKGEFQQVNDFDNYNGLGYWRKNGDVNISEAGEERRTASCATFLQYEFPLKFVACIPKDKLPVDDQYTDDDIANEIIVALTGNNNPAKTAIKAQSVNVQAQKYTSNNQEIISQEYSGIDDVDINYKFAYLSIDFNIVVIINKNCIQSNCP